MNLGTSSGWGARSQCTNSTLLCQCYYSAALPTDQFQSPTGRSSTRFVHTLPGGCRSFSCTAHDGGMRTQLRTRNSPGPGPRPRSAHLLCALLAAMVFLPSPALSPAAAGSAAAFPDARPTAAAPLPASLAWGWPLAGKPRVVHAFDPPAKPWLSGHRGVDLAAPQGIAVLAPTDGVVTFSGVVVNRAVLTIAVENGLRLSFEPVSSTLKAGDVVARGQTVGIVEGPSHCDGAGATSCLHWGVRRGDEYLDPLQFVLDLRPSILLPLTGQ